MANLFGALQSSISEVKKRWKAITATILNEGEADERRALDVVQYDGDGNVLGGETTPVKVAFSAPDTIITGKITVDVPGTPEPLAAESTVVMKVYIKPLRANTDYVAVGDVDVDASSANEQGWSMSDEFPLVLEFADLADLFVDSVVADEGITFIATSIS